MTITVKVSCAWCQATKETSLTQPVPEGWLSTDIQDPDWAQTTGTVEENFCSEDHRHHYIHYAPKAHEAAATDYKAKFYSEMNVLHEKEGKEPREKKAKPEMPTTSNKSTSTLA